MMDDELLVMSDDWSVKLYCLRHVYLIISFNRLLSSNMLSGSIPKEIGNSAKLRWLLVDDG